MKILHIANTDSYSGAENVICQIIGMFKGRHDVDFVYVSPDGPIREALAERNVSFAPVARMCVGELKRVIKEQKPNVIHAHDMKASVVSAFACGNTKLVLHLHNNDFANRRLSFKSISYLLPAYKCSHIYYVSESSYFGYLFHTWFRSKSSVLYNIIDLDALREKASKDNEEYGYDVIYIGRLTYQKNPSRLLRVFRKLVDNTPNIRIGMVGTGELDNQVRQEWTYLNLQDNVDLLGFRSNPLKMLGSSKVMLLTSRWEGTPMCALEAMALGTPIVTTPVDGMMALIHDGKTGFMSDDDDVLAEKVNMIVSDEKLRKSMSDACVADAMARNNADEYVEKLWEVYCK